MDEPGKQVRSAIVSAADSPENNEKPMEEKSGVKFKIMSLKIKAPTDYMPELVCESQREDKIIRMRLSCHIVRVVFLDPENPNPMMEKLKSQLAEADAADEARKKAPEVTSSDPKPTGEGLVIDEWKQRWERYLAQQQGGVDLA
ncbi:vesicle-associated protein 4-3 isoform X2 [Raphanus sativus]|uniref:Vesicle-associated protein 4-3 isoform X2 n=1 Tax=Raphanus sativus TaxID=3726 RepID=A0A9W3CG80_RAPSA|nr:vesicle-associated protein 4-3 isoform X2 [Raphanus sativus]